MRQDDADGDGGAERRRELIAAARAVRGDLPLRRDFSAGSVGAAVRTEDGNLYTGICIDLASGLGFCAEVAAIGQMVTAREVRIDAVVAVGADGVLPPCGRCRETIAQLHAGNLDGCSVILGPDREVPLRELLPDHWLDADGSPG